MRIEFLKNPSLIRDMALIHLVLREVELKLSMAGIHPDNIVAEVVHYGSVRVRHVCQLSQILEKCFLQVSINLA